MSLRTKDIKVIGKPKMQQVKTRTSSVNISFEKVAEAAERILRAGRRPTLNAICKELNFWSVDKVRQYVALWKAGYSPMRTDKTHILDLPSDLQRLLADDFERRVVALRTKLKAECYEIRVDRDRLVIVNEQRASQIETLNSALMDAEAKLEKQARQVARLENELASERNIRIQMEQRIRDARQELTNMEHRLENPLQESGGGA
jgi:hypothetical protein